MRLFGRRPKLPAALRPELEADERVLAWAAVGPSGSATGSPVDEAVLVATNRGVWLPGDPEPGTPKPATPKSGDPKSGGFKPGDAGSLSPGDAGGLKPGDPKSGGLKPGDPKSGGLKPGDPKSGGLKPGDPEPGGSKPGRRLGWHEIHKAAWSGRELRITPAEVAVVREDYAVLIDAPPVTFLLLEPGELPDQVRTRVTRSVAYTSHHPLPQGGGVRVVGRRVSGVDGLSWAVRYDSGTPVDNDQVIEITRELVQAAQGATTPPA